MFVKTSVDSTCRGGGYNNGINKLNNNALMDSEEIKKLVQKLNEGTSTQEEEIALLKELNNGVETLRSFVKMVAEESKAN